MADPLLHQIEVGLHWDILINLSDSLVQNHVHDRVTRELRRDLIAFTFRWLFPIGCLFPYAHVSLMMVYAKLL